MGQADRRKFERKDSQNLINYTVLGEEGETITRNMGRTLDVSEEGLLLETHIPLKKNQNILLTVALEEDMVDLKGKVVRMKQATGLATNGYHSGIVFQDMEDEDRLILKKYIAAIKYKED